MYQMHFFCTSTTFSFPGAGLFARSWLRGTQGGRLCTRRKFGPRQGPVACALDVQGHANWQVTTASLSAESEPRKRMKIPHSSFFYFFSSPAVSCLYHTVPQAPKLYFVATAVAHHYALSFVTATEGASVCACAYHVSSRNERIISRGVQRCCAGGMAI